MLINLSKPNTDIKTILYSSRCTSILGEDGEPKQFTAYDRQDVVNSVIQPMAGNGLRTIALAYKDLSKDEVEDWDAENEIIRDLTCIGITGIEDPVRDEVGNFKIFEYFVMLN